MIEILFAALVAMVFSHGRVDGPANQIYAGGAWGTDQKSIYIANGAITPGAGTTAHATDGQIAEGAGGATKSTFTGIAADNIRHDATTFFTDHPTGEEVQTYQKPGAEVFAIIVNSSAALVHGNRLKMGTGGGFEKFVEGTDDENLALLTYIGRADLTPPASGVNRYLCRIGGDA